jgi:Ca2+-binding EF-hand superfamily protein
MYHEKQRLSRESARQKMSEQRQSIRMERLARQLEKQRLEDDILQVQLDGDIVGFEEDDEDSRRSSKPRLRFLAPDEPENTNRTRMRSSATRSTSEVVPHFEHHQNKEQRMSRLRCIAKKKRKDAETDVVQIDYYSIDCPSGPIEQVNEDNLRSRRAAEDPHALSWLDDFHRYDTDNTELLQMRGVRMALADIGLQPHTPAEKKAFVSLIMEELQRNEFEGVDFDGFIELVAGTREARDDISRPALEDLFEKGCEGEIYNVQQHLKHCLDMLGCKNADGESEWAEVMAIFDGYALAAYLIKMRNQEWDQKDVEDDKPGGRVQFAQGGNNAGNRDRSDAQEDNANASSSKAPARGNANGMRRRDQVGNVFGRNSAVQHLQQREDGCEMTPFEFWEALVHKAQERLIVLQRVREREVAQEMKLTDAQLEDYRSDLVELYELFKQFDVDGSGTLQEEEVMKCLNCCGLQRTHGKLSHEAMSELLIKAKLAANADMKAHLDREAGSEDGEMRKQISDGSGSGNGRQNTDELLENFTMELNHAEFLTLMTMVRQLVREASQPELQAAFKKYDTDRSGSLQVKEILVLFANLGLTPRTREEQREIRMILDEVDENGDGEFNFQEFEVLVHRTNEHLDRLTRKQEEDYAAEIGLSCKRCRELRDIFQSAKHLDSMVLSISQLREVVEGLYHRYSSDELLSLFYTFGREDGSGVTGKGFLRMMHAIEIAKTHGQPVGQMPVKKEITQPSL